MIATKALSGLRASQASTQRSQRILSDLCVLSLQATEHTELTAASNAAIPAANRTKFARLRLPPCDSRHTRLCRLSRQQKAGWRIKGAGRFALGLAKGGLARTP